MNLTAAAWRRTCRPSVTWSEYVNIESLSRYQALSAVKVWLTETQS